MRLAVRIEKGDTHFLANGFSIRTCTEAFFVSETPSSFIQERVLKLGVANRLQPHAARRSALLASRAAPCEHPIKTTTFVEGLTAEDRTVPKPASYANINGGGAYDVALGESGARR